MRLRHRRLHRSAAVIVFSLFLLAFLQSCTPVSPPTVGSNAVEASADESGPDDQETDAIEMDGTTENSNDTGQPSDISPDPTATLTPLPTASTTPAAHPDPSDDMERGPYPEATEIEADEGQVSLIAGGDVLMHSHLINGGLEADGDYNYDYAFRYMNRLTAQYDLSLANMEGTLAGEPYTGFPLFSAPDAVASGMASGGFNIAQTANNHIIDKSSAGFFRTIDVLRANGMTVSGSRASFDEPFYQLFDVGGVKVAMTSFSYETVRQDGLRALNALIIPEDVRGLVNSFSMQEPYMGEDFARMGRLAQTMRNNGAEIVIFNIHWGTEYSVEENWYQQTLAGVLADNHVDLIIGSGPHVVQPIKEVKASDSEHSTLVYYSVGNLLSDQVYSTADTNGLAEDGILASVRFRRGSDGQMEIVEAGYIATYVYKVRTGDAATRNTIIPVEAALADPGNFEIDGRTDLLTASKSRTSQIMAGNQSEQHEILSLNAYK